MENLIEYAKTYKHFYTLDIKNVFHTAVGCVVGQQVAFNIGRNIRKQLYEICGNPLTREAILNADLTQIIALKPSRAKLLIEMAKINDQQEVEKVINEYSKLNGFGKWTTDAVSILMQTSNTINLSTDSYIRKNIELYTGTTMTQKRCHEYISFAGINQTDVCYFLWRLKKGSVCKVLNKELLTKDDFI